MTCMRCDECYSEYARLTPLFKPEYCLQQHEQYICSTCGRVMCVDEKEAAKARCFMLFKSLDAAVLYVRAAEVLAQNVCGVYKIDSAISAEIGYKIFPNQDAMTKYFGGNTDKKCCSADPLFISPKFLPPKTGQIRRLTSLEIRKYLQGYQSENIIRMKLLTTT